VKCHKNVGERGVVVIEEEEGEQKEGVLLP